MFLIALLLALLFRLNWLSGNSLLNDGVMYGRFSGAGSCGFLFVASIFLAE